MEPEAQRPALGLRGRLLAVALPLVALAFGAVYWLATATAREGLVGLSDANLSLSAENLARTLRSSLADARADALATARLDLAAEAIDTGDPKNLRWFADEMLQSKEKYAAIVVADAEGRIVGSNTVRRDGRRLADRPEGEVIREAWAARALGAPRDRPTWIPPGRPAFLRGSLGPDEHVAGYSLPVWDILDQPIGTVTVLVSLDHVGEVLGGYVTGSGTNVESAALIADERGRPLALPPALRRGWARARLPDAADGATWWGPDRHEHRLAAAPLEVPDGPTWRVVQLRRQSAFEAVVASIGTRLLPTFAIGLLGTLLVLALVATRFLGPIRRLTGALGRTQRAADMQAVPVETRDEIGTLTAAFNRMAGTIQEYERGLEEKVAARTRELRDAKQAVSDILDNMSQGIFTVGPDGKVGREHSAFCREIFGDRPIAGEHVLELLQGEERVEGEAVARMTFWLENIFGADDLQWSLTEGDPLASAVHVRRDGQRRHLRLEYAPMYEGGRVAKVMVVAKDVTEVIRLETEMATREEEHRADLARAAEIAQLDPELFDTFMTESGALLDQCEAGLGGEDAVHAAFRAMHTLKGNARIFKLTSLQDAAHEIETELGRIRDAGGKVGTDVAASLRARFADARKLLAGYQSLGQKFLAAGGGGGAEAARRVATARVPTARILELRRAYKDLARGLAEAGAVVPPAVADTSERLGHAVQELTMVPLSELLGRMRKLTLDLARELDRPVADLATEGDEIEVDTKLIDKLSDVLGHALRNAVDHGIEPSGERPAGKPGKGTITVRARWDARDLVIDVADDGRGIDLDRVRRIAVARGAIPPDRADAAEEAELLDLLFQPGFTTVERVSLVSGRGVGLDVIRTTMRALKGEATLRTEPGRGTTVTLRIPADYYQQL